MKWKLILVINLTYHTLSGQNPLDKSFLQVREMMEKTDLNLPWISLGPVVNSARVEAVQIDHRHPGTFYVAFGSGNLWKTVDHGITWKPVFEQMPSHGIGDIALAPSNPQVIYLGTGESLRKQRNFTLPGNGIYRSDNGGSSWVQRGLSDNWHIGEIAVHPEDPDIVFVAAMGKFWSADEQQGIYKSVNGGRDWKRVLYVDERTRANDIVISPSNPEIIYATMWENDIDATLPESVFGPQSGVYKSIDAGETWLRMSNGLPVGLKTGRMGVAVSWQDPEVAYVLVDNLNRERSRASEIYRTKDGGMHWQRTHVDDLMLSSTIGWYFADIYVNPKNDQEIFGLGVRIAHSVDGGETFDFMDGEVQHIQPSPAQTLHLDQCELWINPENPKHIAVGNDGGFYLSYDRGDHWMHYNNIPAGEFYTITLDQRSPYLIYGGTQDDATVFGPPEEYRAGQPDPWQYLWIDAWSGGDGCVTQLDPDDPDIIYFSMQEGYVMRLDRSSGTATPVRPQPDSSDAIELQYHFVAPYFISPHQGRTLYHAGNYVFKSTDRGEHWKRISPDLSTSAIGEKRSLAASAFVESPWQKGQLFLGTDHGAFWTSTDDGQNWMERSKGLANAYIRSIYPSKFDSTTLYLSMTGLNYDDLSPYLYRSDDLGLSWHQIAEGLPEQPVNVVIEDRHFPNLIFAGTHRGVFISKDRGSHWTLLGSEFPLVPVADLAINKQDELIIATHGRGIYKVDLSPVYFSQLTDSTDAINQIRLFPVLDFPAGKLRSSHHDVDRASVRKQNFYYSLPEKRKITLKIVNERQQTLWTQEREGKKGINCVRFDQVLSTRELREPYLLQKWNFIQPGKYNLELEVGTTRLRQPFKVYNPS